jgi:hypothetical protein
MVTIIDQFDVVLNEVRDSHRLMQNLERAIEFEFSEEVKCLKIHNPGCLSVMVADMASSERIMSIYFPDNTVKLYDRNYRDAAIQIANVYEKLIGKEVTLKITPSTQMLEQLK